MRSPHHPLRRLGVATAFAVVGAAAGAVSLTTTIASATPELPPAATAAAERGAAWLADRVGSDGAVRGADGSPSYGDTRETALALAAVTTEPAALERAVQWLADHLTDDALGSLDLSDSSGRGLPGRIAQLVLIATATGRDPRAFGGTADANDLIARLEATQIESGADAGRFGAQGAIYDGAFRQGLALAALGAVGRPDAIGTAWLAEQQCDDGSWMGQRPDLEQACAFDPETFAGPDTNNTALATIGLVAACSQPRVDVAAYARTAQGDDGGWSYSGFPSEASDPNSTAVMIMALLALGLDPTEFAIGDADPVEALIAFQFDTGEDSGAFWFPPFGDATPTANLMATTQAVIALAGRTLPLTAPACPPPTSTTSTTTASSSTTLSTTTAAPTTTLSPTTAAPTTQSPAAAPAAQVASRTSIREAPAATAVRRAVAYAG